MKLFFIYILTLPFGNLMQENKNNELPVRVSIELPDTICAGQQNIPIILVVENTTSEVLSIRNPAHWGNAYPCIKQGDKEITAIKVKINPAVFKDIIQIKEYETLRIKFDFTLDKIFSLEFYPSGQYSIYFELCPDEKMSIKSDIFSFYKQ
jgi:hypothetical protein